jgi:DNA-binding transcriptional MerR regulator/methylmalonyl-CoA mutase cobalamin-binding subunit
VYSVQHAARLTGIPADTLRMWERRYHVVDPVRSDAGYRMYDDAALRRLSAMRALVAAGWSPRLAAEQVKSGTSDGVPRGEAVGSAAPEPLDLLAALAADLDPLRLETELTRVFASAPFEDLADAWLMPSLARLGDAWLAGSVSVAGEHFVSAGLHRHVARVLESAVPAPGAPRVMVGLSRASRHELGVLTFAALLRRSGAEVIYVGADLPSDSWSVAAATSGVEHVVLGVPTEEDVPGVRDAVAALAAAAPQVTVHVGGGRQDEIGPPALRLGHGLVAGAQDLAASLGARVPATGPSAPGSPTAAR